MTDGPDRWVAAMQEALRLAQSADAPYGENPRVGCVIVAPDGSIVGRGHHRGAGTPHAEVVALREAGPRARGATAVVTLEPCRHTGRTGPCTAALVDAGVDAVVYAQDDPSAGAGGGAAVLRDHAIVVTGGVLADEAERVNEAWTFAVLHGRPMVTWKTAASLDGRVADAHGGPTSISGPDAHRLVHELRAQVGAIVVGTGTVLVDDPALTVRRAGRHALVQPLRVVVGSRAIPRTARVRDDSAPTLLTSQRDPALVLADLFARGVRHALLEGGPTLAAAFIGAGVVDRIDWFVAPVLFGAGPVALPPLGAGPVATAGSGSAGVDVTDVTLVGEDVRIRGWVRYERRQA